MKYPEHVQKKIDFLNTYRENPELKTFHILHLYPGKLAAINNWGHVDSRAFRLVGFNTQTMEKRDLGIHDGVEFFDSYKSLGEGVNVIMLRVFADGAFLVKFTHAVHFRIYTQNQYLYGREE